MSDTYEPPAHGWTCFHCGETFTTVGGASDHFGAKPDAMPGCLMRVQLGGERGLLMALRKVEEELATLYRERADDDTPLHRQIAALQSRHADALENAEETGYARGLRAPRESFQDRLKPWMLSCFGEDIANDKRERNHRFLEEALELVQACECTREEAHALVDYVYGRPVGDRDQEVGGAIVTLAALCLAHRIDMAAAGETELARIWDKIDVIRAKQAAKPKHGPLPAEPDGFTIRLEDAPGEGVIIVSTPPVGELMGKFRKAFDGRSATPAEALFMTAWIAIAEEAQRIGAKHNGAG